MKRTRFKLIRHTTIYITLLFLLLSATSALAQKKAVKYDTIKLVKNTTLLLKDSSIKFDKDTVLILPDTLFYRVKGGNFYRKLKDRWYQRKFTKQLFDLLFSLPSEDFKLDTTNLVKSVNPFTPYRDRVIGNVELRKLQALGTKLADTTKRPRSVLQKVGNTINFNTRDRVLFNNLLFKSGEPLNPSIIADNERIIRELPFIKDARFYVIEREDSDTVDLELVTKDVLSLSVDLQARDFDSGVFEIDHRNIFGSGHRIDNRFILDNDRNQVFGYEVHYSIPNIKRSFTSFELGYADTDSRDFVRMRISREFVSPAIKWAGGFEWSQQQQRDLQLVNIVSDQEFDQIFIQQQFDYQDFWLARAYPLRMKNLDLKDRTRLIVSGRLSRIDYLDRPRVDSDLNQIFHNRFLAIGAIGFSQQRYFKDQLIFGFGRTEDIPYGNAIELLGGYEWGEFFNRYYFGFRASTGNYLGNAGYFWSDLALEGYLNNGDWQQGVVKTDARFISNLIDFNTWKFRQFITVSYTSGLKRFQNEFVDLRDRNGIRGLKSNTLRGTQRFLLNLETVAFAPFDLVNFKFAFFGFYDYGLINFGQKNIFGERAQQGIGFGVRIRNDNLTFKAIEIRFAYYPNAPIGIEGIDLDFSGNSGFRFDDFFIGRPEVNIFR